MKKNMGPLDRRIRIIIAVILVTLYASGTPGTVGVVFPILATVLALTSLAGTCPLYLPFGVTTLKKDADYSVLLKAGARIVDVRSINEYYSGHVEGSINIPLPELQFTLFRIQNKNVPVIVCCASGVRSAKAAKVLSSVGYTRVKDGGSWLSLQSNIRKAAA